MTQKQKSSEPMFNFGEMLPVYLVGLFVIIHLILGVTGTTYFSWTYGALKPWGTAGIDPAFHIFNLFSHGFLHGDWMHVFMNSGMILIFGIITIQSIRDKIRADGVQKNAELVFLSIFLFGVIAGGLAQWAFWGLETLWTPPGGYAPFALGASGGASALLATTGWAMGGRTQMMGFSFAWLLLNLVFFFYSFFADAGIAWAAHLGGLGAGIILAPLCLQPYSARR